MKTHPIRTFRIISTVESPYMIQREDTTGEIRHRLSSANNVAPWVEGYPPLPKELSDDEVLERITAWSNGLSNSGSTYGTTDIEFANDVKRLLKMVEDYRENY